MRVFQRTKIELFSSLRTELCAQAHSVESTTRYVAVAMHARSWRCWHCSMCNTHCACSQFEDSHAHTDRRLICSLLVAREQIERFENEKKTNKQTNAATQA